ncbi:hypothetical protein HGM15179_020175, partial [Zosterops borbonicus]
VLGEPAGTPDRPLALTPGLLLTELLHNWSTPELVALAPLLSGIEALGTSFLLVQGRDNNATALGPGSSWGDAMDGVVLGTQLAQGPLSVAELLRSNYGTGNGLEGWLEKEMAEFLGVLRTLLPSPELLREVGTQEVAAMAPWAAREFSKRYVCPTIVPHCLWDACPCRGTLALLRPLLSSVILHHSLEPAWPCQTLGACACTMRDMQCFHQDTRAWDNIAYRSLSPPRGRGWHWGGAHTKGYNTQGFGVGITGDFMATLPDPDTLAL